MHHQMNTKNALKLLRSTDYACNMFSVIISYYGVDIVLTNGPTGPEGPGGPAGP